MADTWEELTTTFSSNKWDYKAEFAESNKPVEFEGIFKSHKSDVGQYKSHLYTFEDKAGEEVVVWGATALDRTMEQLIGDLVVIEGDTVKIIYKGKVKNPATGRMFNSFKVYKKVVKK
jgi:hypothetical protein